MLCWLSVSCPTLQQSRVALHARADQPRLLHSEHKCSRGKSEVFPEHLSAEWEGKVEKMSLCSYLHILLRLDSLIKLKTKPLHLNILIPLKQREMHQNAPACYYKWTVVQQGIGAEFGMVHSWHPAHSTGAAPHPACCRFTHCTGAVPHPACCRFTLWFFFVDSVALTCCETLHSISVS